VFRGTLTRVGPAREPLDLALVFHCEQRRLRSNFIAARFDEAENPAQQPKNPGNVG